MSENITRKELSDAQADIRDLKKDVSNLNAWRDNEVDPMIEEVKGFKNQFKGATKALWIIALLLTLLVSDRVADRIPIVRDFIKLLSQDASSTNPVKASNSLTVVKRSQFDGH